MPIRSDIRKVFDFVNGDNYVMLLDEFDAIARSRNDRHKHGEIKRVVNTFLQQIDNFKARSLVIAATNYEQSPDYAIWRRFDNTLHFDMPNNMENSSHSDVERVAHTVIKQFNQSFTAEFV